MLLEQLETRRMMSWIPTATGTTTLRREGWTVVQGVTFTAPATREACAPVGLHKVIYRYDVFNAGSCNFRAVDCSELILDHNVFNGAIGTPDPDGHDCQLIRVRNALVEWCQFRANPGHTEDLLNIYSDKPIGGTVLVEDNTFIGHGPTDSGCSIVMDGPFPPATTIFGDTISGARCGVTVAGSTGCSLVDVVFRRCEEDIYVANLYGAAFKSVAVVGCDLEMPIVVAKDVRGFITVR